MSAGKYLMIRLDRSGGVGGGGGGGGVVGALQDVSR